MYQIFLIVIIIVLGELNPDQLGRTLTHEHLSMEYFTFYTTPKESDIGK